MNTIVNLSSDYLSKIVKNLNSLLSDYEIFYQNLRGFHWNILGKDFFVLHAKFEELYNETAETIDEIAERILTLGELPLHSYSDFLQHSQIKEAKNIREGKKAVEITVENLKLLISKKREIIKEAANNNDDGTITLLSDLLTKEEKTLWMLNTYLSD